MRGTITAASQYYVRIAPKTAKNTTTQFHDYEEDKWKNEGKKSNSYDGLSVNRVSGVGYGLSLERNISEVPSA